MRDKIIAVLEDFNDELIEDLDRDLIAENILDSFDIVSLVMHIEDNLNIAIDIDKVTHDNFRTTANIIAMIEESVE